MPKRKRQELERAHFNLRRGDMERLQELYPSGAGPKVRQLIEQHLDAIDKRVDAELERRGKNERGSSHSES